MNLESIQRNDIIAFIGPGKTGTSSLYEAAKEIDKFQMISSDVKETYIHSFDDIKNGFYKKVLWSSDYVEELRNSYNSKINSIRDKVYTIFEPSYADSDKALSYCAKECSNIVITIRPSIDRIVSHILMDIKLGLISNWNEPCCCQDIQNRMPYYFLLTNYFTLHQRIQYFNSNANIVFLNLSQRMIYTKTTNMFNIDNILLIAKRAHNIRNNESVMPSSFIGQNISSVNLLRRIGRLSFLSKYKEAMYNILYTKTSLQLKSKIKSMILEQYESTISVLNRENTNMLKSYKILEF